MMRCLVAGLVTVCSLTGLPAAAQTGDGSLRGYLKDQLDVFNRQPPRAYQLWFSYRF